MGKNHPQTCPMPKVARCGPPDRVGSASGIAVSAMEEPLGLAAFTTLLAMTTVELSPTPPSQASPYDEWKVNLPNCLRTHDMAHNAGRHADQQVEAGPSNQEAKDHLRFATVAECLLLEFFNQRAILYEIPCVSLVKRLISPPQASGRRHTPRRYH